MKPAARISDMHACPMVTPGTPPIPHVGGPVIQGAPNVIIGGMPASRVGDMATCVGPPDTIATGSATVLICGMPAARMGDSTTHGGVIVTGFPTVLIGDSAISGGPDSGGQSANALKGAIPKMKLPDKGKQGAGVVAAAIVGAAKSAPDLQAKALRKAASSGAAVCQACSAAEKSARRKRRNPG